jgi:hypothetical protein
MGDHRVILSCGCGKAGASTSSTESTVPDPPPTTGIEGETGAAQ